MKKIGDVTSTADKNGEFTDGNVAAGTPPTQLMGDWFNSVQREIINVLIKAGVTQSKDRDDQLSESIAKLIGSAGYQLEGYGYSKVESNLKFQPIGNYAPAGDYATNTALANGLNQKLNASSVVQSTGSSTTNVMSQKAVTDAFVKDIRLGTPITLYKNSYTNVFECPAGNTLTSVDVGDEPTVTATCRPIQKLINSTWYTVSQL
ncbi:hypothetical protein ABN356_02655 [Providencia rettgeri]